MSSIKEGTLLYFVQQKGKMSDFTSADAIAHEYWKMAQRNIELHERIRLLTEWEHRLYEKENQLSQREAKLRQNGRRCTKVKRQPV